MNIKIKKLNPEAVIPKYAHVGDAGMDLFSIEDKVLKPMERYAVGTGISMEYPEGFCTLIWDKSGLAINHGIKTMGGVIEPNYRGEYKVIMINLSDKDFEIKKGQKIAQVLIQPIVCGEIEEVDELSDTNRGHGGFGSTGK